MATQDIVDALIDDHNEFRALFARLDSTPAGGREDLFREIVSELARHEAAEEAVVHPAARDAAGNGGTVVDAVLEEESRAEKLMADMEKMDPESDEFLAAFESLRRDVLAHAEHEERDEFPQLRRNLDTGARQQLAERFERLKDVGPTRPHPLTPQNPAVRAAAGPIAGIFDRARDAAREAFNSN